MRLAPASTVLLVVVVLLGGGRAGAEEASPEELRALARNRLIQDARVGMRGGPTDPSDPTAGAIEQLRISVWKERALWQQVAPASFAELAGLLGLDGLDGDDLTVIADPRGAIRQAAWLYRWLSAPQDACQLVFRKPGAPPGPDTYWPYTPEAWEKLDEADRRRRTLLRHLDILRLGDLQAEPAAQLQLEVDFSVPDSDPPRTERRDAVAYLRAPPPPDTFALIHPEELEDMICPAWLVLRERQVESRVQAWRAERPTDLVSQGEVEERERRVALMADGQTRIEERRQQVLDGLDAMVAGDTRLRRRAYELESALKESREQEGADDPQTEAGRARTETRVEELLVRQKQRLLYIAVWRASRRLELYERALGLGVRELSEAQTVCDIYRQSLRRVRREYERDRLALDRARLAGERQEARTAQEGAAESDRPHWDEYLGVLDAVEELNHTLNQLIDLRRDLEVRLQRSEETRQEESPPPAASPPTPVPSPSTPAADATDGAANGENAGPPGGAAPTETAPPESPPQAGMRILREPARHIHQANFVELVRQRLHDPDLDAEAVAEIYAAADDTIRGWDQALSQVAEAERLVARFEDRRASLDKRMAALRTTLPARRWELRRELPDLLAEYAELSASTLEGVVEERKEAHTHRDDLSRLCEELRGLGERSFGIRVSRDLNREDLKSAGKELQSFFGAAFGWLTFQGERHLGTWLATNWPVALAFLVLVAASILSVRTARRRLDDLIQRRAARVPALRGEAVTVADEAEDRRQIEEERDEAAKEAEAAALRDASREELEQQQAKRVLPGGEADAGDEPGEGESR